MKIFDQLHPDWQFELEHLRKNFDAIETALKGEVIAPDFDMVMRALSVPIDSIQVVIFGQDPYPKEGLANGLAFGAAGGNKLLPPSLRNIFTELRSDCGEFAIENSELLHWAEQGVLLLNRILTTRVGQSLAHSEIGWQVITDEVARVLGQRDVIAILWGKFAIELKIHFKPALTICSTHPSPLSAYRGFFGSKPFSKTNKLLLSMNKEPINW